MAKYYRLDKILKMKAQYNFIFGERSNGKTFAVLEYGLRQYVKTGQQMAIIRRWADDFKGARGASMFESLVSSGVLKRITGEEWTDVYYHSARWYLCRYDEKSGKRISDTVPFCFGFSLGSMEHDKSTSYPYVTTILFDECITRQRYISDEFVIFCNVLSTIIRDRDNVKIFMLGNTVNKFCPYFNEMGLRHVKQMNPGDIEVYTYGTSDLRVAVEYTEPNIKGKKSDTYFSFDNPKLKMITGGAWELDIYPHLPCKYKPKNVVFEFFIEFDKQFLHCDIVSLPDKQFIYIYPKTDGIKNETKDLVYTTEYNPLPNYRRNILKPIDKIDRKIYELFKSDKVFYATNETGEVLRNYLIWCGKN